MSASEMQSPFFDGMCEAAARKEAVSWDRMYEAGYRLVGATAFLAAGDALIDTDRGYALGDEVCADVAVLEVRKVGTTSGTVYIPGGTSTTTVDSKSTTYGSGGHSTTYGTVSTSTPNPDIAVPYTTNWYRHVGSYWAKHYYILGILPADQDRAERRAKGWPPGARVEYVIMGSSVADTDIMRGDIITKCDGAPIRSADELTMCSWANSGKTITLTVFNGRVEQDVTVELARAPRGFNEWVNEEAGDDPGDEQ